MRRLLRRAARRGAVARDDRACAHRARQPRAPRSSRGRRPHRRRRRDPRPAARRVLPRGRRRGPACGRPLRRRRLLPAARGRAAHGARAAARDRRPRGGAGRDRVARRARRPAPRRRDRARSRAPHPPALRRRGARPRRRRVRAQAVRDPPPRRAGRRPRARRAELLVATGRLQGNVDGAAASGLLPGPPARGVRERARARPLALLDQHLPELGARASLSPDRAQRRDQHPARERELDAGTRVAARVRALRRRPREGAADDPAGRLRHRDVRQRPRVAAARGTVAPARGDDDDPRGVPGPRRPARRAEGLLRVPRLRDGAVGRAGGDRLHRRPRDRSDARPQRPSPRPLVRDAGRLGRDGVGDRRPRRAAGEHRAQGPPPAGKAVSRRSRPRPDRRGRGGQARGLLAAAVQPLVRRAGRAARRPARARAADAAVRDAAQAPARVRLRAGGLERHPRAARPQRGGGGRLDGQRLVARSALRPQAAALLVLQAALRAGDEPADRLDPRGGRDERAGGGRPAAQPVRRDP